MNDNENPTARPVAPNPMSADMLNPIWFRGLPAMIRAERARMSGGLNFLIKGGAWASAGMLTTFKLARDALSRERAGEDRGHQLFEYVVKLKGMTDADLAHDMAGLAIRARRYLLMAFFLPTMYVGSLLLLGARIDIFGFICFMLLVAYCLTTSLRSRLNHWQIRNRRLGGVLYFISRPKLWWIAP